MRRAGADRSSRVAESGDTLDRVERIRRIEIASILESEKIAAAFSQH